MYIPMVSIPGCRADYNNDNRQAGSPFGKQALDGCEAGPRETVAIRFSSLPAYQAAAEFYSYIAYPDPAKAIQRTKYSVALARWAVLQRMIIDKNWREEALVRPVIFSQAEKLYLQTYKRGSLLWWRRGQCASLMLLPHLVAELFDRTLWAVGNAALISARVLGYGDGSHKTVEIEDLGSY